jgi:hypothetical protein
MKTIESIFTLRRRLTRFAAMFALFTSLGAVAVSAQAPPYALMQDSTLTGTGNTINVTQLPVVLSTGTIYVDLTILFDVAADGTLTVASGYPMQVAAPQTKDDGFAAGDYSENPDNGGRNVGVSGPGVAGNGATVWSMGQIAGSFCTNPNSATWWDVGTAIKNSPIYSRLKAAGITSTQFAQFGVNGPTDCGGSTLWQNNALLGFTQSGNSLVVTSYTNNGKDQNTPVATQTFFATTQ